MGHSIGRWEGATLVVDTIGVKAGALNGSGSSVVQRPGDRDARMPYTETLHLTERMRLLDEGQILEGHSISAGLDYPGVGPEHSFLHDTGRVTYVPITDNEAIEAFQLCTRLEGIIPALESAHGLAEVMKLAPTMGKDETVVLCLSGRGDKDVESVGRHLGLID